MSTTLRNIMVEQLQNNVYVVFCVNMGHGVNNRLQHSQRRDRVLIYVHTEIHFKIPGLTIRLPHRYLS
jgi:hypothetical protein